VIQAIRVMTILELTPKLKGQRKRLQPEEGTKRAFLKGSWECPKSSHSLSEAWARAVRSPFWPSWFS